MSESTERSMIDVMSGRKRGIGAGGLRLLLSCAEPAYATAMLLRNITFDVGVRKSHRLPRPVISVGNLTTGGTGKTPVVAWMADQLRAAGRHPAILLRGYKSDHQNHKAVSSDEERMLTNALNSGKSATIPVVADPDRVRASALVLARHPETDVFLLDDGFQHRRVARNLDVVLISASNPFGFGHVLPRGLRREPMRGLARASLFIITHANEVAADQLQKIIDILSRRNRNAPVFKVDHVLSGFREFNPARPDRPVNRSVADLGSVRYFAACGIGQPESFLASLVSRSNACIGYRFFGDHHHFTDADLTEMYTTARGARADVMIVTEKDWMKIAALPAIASCGRIWRAQLGLRFWNDDAAKLREKIVSVL